MVRTRNQTHSSSDLHCLHCGNPGHLSTACPRSSYSSTTPALTCQTCIHLIEPDQDSPGTILHRIVTCAEHSGPDSSNSPAGHSSDTTPSGSTATASSTATSATSSTHVGRRLRGVNPNLYKKAYSDVCSLVKSGQSLYDSLEQLKITRGTWRAIRLLAEAMILYEEHFQDRIIMDDIQTQKDAVTVAKELLSLPNTRIDLLNIHREDSAKALKPLPSYTF